MSAVKSKAKLSISPISIGSNGVANRIDASSSTGGFVALRQERHYVAQHYESNFRMLNLLQPWISFNRVTAAHCFPVSLLIEIGRCRQGASWFHWRLRR